MSDSELDPVIERIVRAARQPVAIDPDAKARLLTAIRAEALPVSQPMGWRWLVDRRVMLSPLGSWPPRRVSSRLVLDSGRCREARAGPPAPLNINKRLPQRSRHPFQIPS